MEKGHLRIKTGIDTTGVKAQIEQLENKISELKILIEESDKHPELFNADEVLQYRVELEKSEKALNRLKESTVQYQEVNTRTFKKGVNSLKRFGLALFSIRSIYTGLSRASQTYLSQNENTANKLASIWTFAGNAIGPVIEWMANGILKLIGYLNEFLKVFGIDIVAKANANALKKQAKEQANLNRQMAAFDEKNTLSNNNANNKSLTDYGGIDLSGVQLNEKIVKKLQDLAYWLKENWYWIKEVGKVLGVVFGLAAVNKILSGIGGMLGSAALGTGLLGLQALLVALAAVFTITLAIKGYQEVKKAVEDTKGAYDGLTKSVEYATEQDKKNAEAVWEMYNAGKIGSDGMQKYKKSLDITTASVKDQITSLQKNKSWIGQITGYNKEITKSQEQFANQLSVTVGEYDKLHKAGEITDEEFVDFMNTLKDMIDSFEENGMNVDNLKEKYLQLVEDPYNLTLTAKLKDEVSQKWDNIVNKISRASGLGGLFSFGSDFTGKGGGGGFRFARGGIVTQPTRALIGEAGYPEVTMPMTTGYLAEFARLVAKYSPGNNVPTTNNIYLDSRLMQRQIASRAEELEFAKNG